MSSHPYPWLVAFHIIFMVTWFAGVFYLPRLFVYHAMTEDEAGKERFKVMERKLMIITNIGMSLTWIFGLAMLFAYAWSAYGSMGWLHAKLALLFLLSGYTGYCGKLVKQFARGENRHSHTWYRWFNEIPVVFLIAIVLLATLKPF